MSFLPQPFYPFPPFVGTPSNGILLTLEQAVFLYYGAKGWKVTDINATIQSGESPPTNKIVATMLGSMTGEVPKCLRSNSSGGPIIKNQVQLKCAALDVYSGIFAFGLPDFISPVTASWTNDYDSTTYASLQMSVARTGTSTMGFGCILDAVFPWGGGFYRNGDSVILIPAFSGVLYDENSIPWAFGCSAISALSAIGTFSLQLFDTSIPPITCPIFCGITDTASFNLSVQITSKWTW